MRKSILFCLVLLGCGTPPPPSPDAGVDETIPVEVLCEYIHHVLGCPDYVCPYENVDCSLAQAGRCLAEVELLDDDCRYVEERIACWPINVCPGAE